MSLWSTIGSVAGGVGGFLLGGPAGAVAGYKGAQTLLGGNGGPPSSGGQIGYAPMAAPAFTPPPLTMPPTYSMPVTQAGMAAGGGSVGGMIASGVISTIGGALINRYAPGGTMTTGSSCGCSPTRDPCTGQKLSHQRAPEASFWGGCCPPGRVLRRRPWARDVCIKKPRMNPFNPAALARADRRITSFVRRSVPIMRELGLHVDTTRHKSGLTKKRKRGGIRAAAHAR